MKHKKKYNDGGFITAVPSSYADMPYDEITQSWIDTAKAMDNVENSKATQLMRYGVNLALPILSYIGTKAVDFNRYALGGGVMPMRQDDMMLMAQGIPPMPMGQMPMHNVPVEVEGGEVIETPQGYVAEVKGPSHEQGGVPAELPENTKVYSKRVKKFNKSMADRKKSRERKKNKIYRKAEDRPYDVILRNTKERVEDVMSFEDAVDMQAQELIKQLFPDDYKNIESEVDEAMQREQEPPQKFQHGGKVKKPDDPHDEKVRKLKNFIDFSFSDFDKNTRDRILVYILENSSEKELDYILKDNTDGYNYILKKLYDGNNRSPIDDKYVRRIALSIDKSGNLYRINKDRYNRTHTFSTIIDKDYLNLLNNNNAIQERDDYQFNRFVPYNSPGDTISRGLPISISDIYKEDNLYNFNRFVPFVSPGDTTSKRLQKKKQNNVYQLNRFMPLNSPGDTISKGLPISISDLYKEENLYKFNKFVPFNSPGDTASERIQTKSKSIVSDDNLYKFNRFVPFNDPGDTLSMGLQVDTADKKDSNGNGNVKSAKGRNTNTNVVKKKPNSKKKRIGVKTPKIGRLKTMDVIEPVKPTPSVGDFSGSFEIYDWMIPEPYIEQPVKPPLNPDYDYVKALNNISGDGDKIDRLETKKLEPNIKPELSSLIDIEQQPQTSSADKRNVKNKLLRYLYNPYLTEGDIIGLFGDIYSTYAPLRTVLESRATDTPNINPYKDFGREALNRIRETRNIMNQLTSEAERSLYDAYQKNMNRSYANSINTQRALDIMNYLGLQRGLQGINQQKTRAELDLLSKEANQMNAIDSKYMYGEQMRDLADRRDKDNFYTQLSRARSNLGRGLQEIGKDLNYIRRNQFYYGLLGNKYGVHVGGDGRLQVDPFEDLSYKSYNFDNEISSDDWIKLIQGK